MATIAAQAEFDQDAETQLRDVSKSGGNISDSSAWVELNYRPHVYQANEGEQEVRQESSKSLTEGVICRSCATRMPDNVAGQSTVQSTARSLPAEDLSREGGVRSKQHEQRRGVHPVRAPARSVPHAVEERHGVCG